MSVLELADNAKTSAGLLATPGALRCEATLGCQVITQGGPEGLRAHQLKVHFNDEWLRGGSDDAG